MKPILHLITREEYISLVKSGMFWVWYPWATGVYAEDVKLSRWHSEYKY